MANVLITRLCNRKCSYCFARGGFLATDRHGNPAALHMTPDAVRKTIDFVKRSKLDVVGLLGGEPVLHPDFTDIADAFLAEGLKLRIFTGGVVPPKTLKYLTGLDRKRVEILVNFPSPSEPLPPAQRKRFDAAIAALGEMAMPAFTLHDPDMDLRFLVDAAVQHGMLRRIRLGLAVPTADSKGEPVLPPSRYRAAAARTLELVEHGHPHGIVVQFDCGFARCMFTAEELDRLQACNCKAAFGCSPIVDIGPALEVWSCLPLVSMGRENLEDFATRDELIACFWKKQRAYRNLGIHEKCMTCDHKRKGECAGGCLAHVIRSFA
jgi:MoaA/NifB/PqqE/SkfB family radical SAM enzyme